MSKDCSEHNAAVDKGAFCHNFDVKQTWDNGSLGGKDYGDNKNVVLIDNKLLSYANIS